MKFIALILFLSLFLFAGNMKLGPYNNPEFKTQIQLAQEKEKRKKEAALKTRKHLKPLKNVNLN